MKKIIIQIILIILINNWWFNIVKAEIKILYKINDEIITTHDVIEEANYLQALNKNFENLEKNQLIQTATQSLIREKIKKREIDRSFEINYDKALNSDNINDLIKNLYTNLGFLNEKEFNEYLDLRNVNKNNLKQKFVIEQMWNQLIVNKYNNVIKINANEINEKVDFIIRNNKEINSYNLSEIVFFEKNKIDNEKKYEDILKSINEVGFEQAAILHSISESAKLGGKIGWINENQISSKIKKAINKLNIDEHSNIINTAAGNIILKVNEKKSEKIEINREEEINKIIRAEKNRLFNQYSIIYYKELENKAYVKKL